MLYAQYDAKDTTVTVDGVIITAFAEDMLSIEKDEDLFSTSVGAQGDVVKNIINNPLGTSTITVQRTSPQYDYLLEKAKQNEPFPFWYTNKKLGERAGGTKANVKKLPTVERGTEVGDVAFEFQLFDLVMEPC